MREFAYIRVSTEDQSFDRQMQVFKEHGITIDKDRIKTEKQSGKNVTGRDVLLKLLNETLESGDVLYVTELKTPNQIPKAIAGPVNTQNQSTLFRYLFITRRFSVINSAYSVASIFMDFIECVSVIGINPIKYKECILDKNV